MAVRDYLRVLGRRWKIIVACLLLGVVVAAIVSTLSPRRYAANAELLVSAEATTNQTDLNQGSAFAQSRVKSYVAVVTSPDVLDRVRSDLSLPISNEQLKAKITATAQVDTTLMTISASDGSPATAAAIANSAARAFATAVEDFETPSGSTVSAIKVLITTPALAPTSPQSPDIPVNIAIGLFLGVLVGLSSAALRELLDVSIKAPEDLAATASAPLLAAIVADAQTQRQPIATKVNARGPRAEGFRQLRTNLQFVDVDHPPRIIAVNSAVPGEGKTSTAVNIAAALAEGGARVCLIDADLRRPMIAEMLGLVGNVGLTNVLIGQVTLEEAFQDVGTLRVLTSGSLPPNPSELLASNHTQQLIRSIADHADFVIVDTAPLLPVADGAEMAAAADGSILVARWGSTSFAQVRRSTEALERVDARLLGVVLNRVPGRYASAYGYTYYGKRAKEAGHRRDGSRGTTTERTPVATVEDATPEAVATTALEHPAPTAAPALPVPAVPAAVAEPEAAAEAVTEPEPEAVAEPEAAAEPEPVVEIAAAPVEPEPVAEVVAAPVADTEPEAAVGPVAEAEPEAAVEPEADTEPEAEAEPVSTMTAVADHDALDGPTTTTITVRRSTPVRRPKAAPRMTGSKPRPDSADLPDSDDDSDYAAATVTSAPPTAGAPVDAEVLDLDRHRSKVS